MSIRKIDKQIFALSKAGIMGFHCRSYLKDFEELAESSKEDMIGYVVYDISPHYFRNLIKYCVINNIYILHPSDFSKAEIPEHLILSMIKYGFMLGIITWHDTSANTLVFDTQMFKSIPIHNVVVK